MFLLIQETLLTKIENINITASFFIGLILNNLIIMLQTMNEYLEIIIRSSISVVFLFVIAKSLGAKQISQMNFYDYILGITIGSIAATLCIDRDIDILYFVVGISIFVLGDIIVSFLSRKSIIGRRFLNGNPIILIEKGIIKEKALKRVHFNINDLLRELRLQGYFDVSDIFYAVLEVNGMLSVMPKEDKRQVNLEDLNIIKKSQNLCNNVIIDGKIMEGNLKETNKTKEWLQKELKKQGITVLENILLATLKKDKLSVYLKISDKSKRTVFQ